MFTALAVSGIIPIAQVALMEGSPGLARFPLGNIAITCSSYAIGTSFYVARLPEKRWPGTFDIWVRQTMPPRTSKADVFFPCCLTNGQVTGLEPSNLPHRGGVWANSALAWFAGQAPRALQQHRVVTCWITVEHANGTANATLKASKHSILLSVRYDMTTESASWYFESFSTLLPVHYSAF